MTIVLHAGGSAAAASRAPCGLGTGLRQLPCTSAPSGSRLRPRCSPAAPSIERCVPLTLLGRAQGRNQGSGVQRQVVCHSAAESKEGIPSWILEYGYLLAGAAWLAVCVAKIGFPQKVAEILWKSSLMPSAEMMLQVDGGKALIAAVFGLGLRNAVASGRLGSATYERLGRAYAIQQIAYLLLILQIKRQGVLTIAGVGVQAAAAVAVVALHVAAFKEFPIGPSIFNDAWGSLKATFSPGNSVALGYAAIAAVAFVLTVACLAVPHVVGPYLFLDPLANNQTLGTFGEALVRGVGLSTFFTAVAAFVLQDAAERDRLGATTFRRLNLGMALTGLSEAVLVGMHAYAKKQRPGLAVAFGALVALFAGYHFFAAEAPSSSSAAAVSD